MPLFTRKPPSPPIVPTDTITPLHYWDTQPHTKSICVDVTLRFDDVLDPEKVRSSLAHLLTFGDWRKLGARIRQNAAGKLEYHIPAEFDQTRPAFIFTTDQYNILASEYSVVSRLPTAASTPCLYGGTQEFRSFFCSPKSPTTLDGWLYSDLPQLAIHLVQFEDATFLSVTFMHTLMDAMGLSALLNAWSVVLNGEYDKVPIFAGFRDDPLAPLTEDRVSPVPSVVADKLLKGLGFFIFVIRFIFDLLWYRKDSERILVIPGNYIDRMRDEARASLDKEVIDCKKPFLSEGDILVSWGTRAILRAIGTASNRTVTIFNIFSCREILSKIGHIPSAGVALITNAVYPAHTFLSVQEILDKPLHFVASHIRQSLEQQRTKEQLQATMTLQKKEIEKSGRLPVFGDPTSQLIAWTNWHKARLFEVDFSSAVIKPGIKLNTRANPLGMPSYVSPFATTKEMPLRNSCSIIGKDHAGNWWLIFILRDGAWPKIAQQLDSLRGMNGTPDVQ
ncbi:hypothetical protein N7454_006314 [Penicillium verhagenii]|nr:hypothetical protein N7454_006314 [Penicillium verhagenii]